MRHPKDNLIFRFVIIARDRRWNCFEGVLHLWWWILFFEIRRQVERSNARKVPRSEEYNNFAWCFWTIVFVRITRITDSKVTSGTDKISWVLIANGTLWFNLGHFVIVFGETGLDVWLVQGDSESRPDGVDETIEGFCPILWDIGDGTKNKSFLHKGNRQVWSDFVCRRNNWTFCDYSSLSGSGTGRLLRFFVTLDFSDWRFRLCGFLKFVSMIRRHRMSKSFFDFLL